MIDVLKKIINNYYWIYITLALMIYVGLPDMYSIIVLGIVAVAFISFGKCLPTWNTMDTIIVMFMVYQLMSCAFSNYSISIWYYGVKGQIVPMLFYFVGRNIMFADNMMLRRMRYPMVFAMTVGLVLYFLQPEWYMAKRLIKLTAESSEAAYYEVTRLSSFWPWSYTMGFASLFYIMYYTKDIFSRKINYLYFGYFVVALLTLFFAQQRVSIAYFVVYLCYLLLFYKGQNKNRLKYLLIIIGVFCFCIYFYLTTYADGEFLSYVLNRSIESDNNIVDDRFAQFSDFWKITLFGDGLGRYGHAVLMYKMKSITDCEYIRLMAELGVVGCAMFLVIYLKSILRAFHYRKVFSFELMVLAFYLVAMIGATPLENNSMQNFLFWYCMGRIANRQLLNYPPPMAN